MQSSQTTWLMLSLWVGVCCCEPGRCCTLCGAGSAWCGVVCGVLDVARGVPLQARGHSASGREVSILTPARYLEERMSLDRLATC